MQEVSPPINASPVTVEIDRYLTVSTKLETSDLDWEAAARVGLTNDEVFVLTYFSDIEGQTIVYLRDLLSTKAALEPEVSAFLTIWNYEEFFHGRALAQLLEVCGHPLSDRRTSDVRQSARFSEALEAMGASLLSRVFSRDFPAVHMAWGAVQEITTLRGYEELSRATRNPVLKLLCDRIAKQERRHFAWYYNNAKERMIRSSGAQRLVRLLLSRFWTPVGAGVKTENEVRRVLSLLFPDEISIEVADDIDGKIGALPGLDGISLMRGYIARA